MRFLLNSQAQGVSGKNEQSTQTPWRGAQCSCIGLTPALFKTTFNGGFQTPTRWEPFAAATMLRCPELTKDIVEPTTLSIIAIAITHSDRFTLLLLLRIHRYMWRNHVTTWA